MVTDGREEVRKHAVASRHYLENALDTLTRREPGKAGELLWGSLAQALHAVALYRNVPTLKNHRSLRWFVSTIASDLNDESLPAAFRRAEALHSNFHTVELSVEDVASDVEPITRGHIEAAFHIPPELQREPATPPAGQE